MIIALTFIIGLLTGIVLTFLLCVGACTVNF